VKGIIGDMALLLAVPQPTTVVTTTKVELLMLTGLDFMNNMFNNVPKARLQEFHRGAQQRHDWATQRVKGNFELGNGPVMKALKREKTQESMTLRESRRASLEMMKGDFSSKLQRTQVGAKSKPLRLLQGIPVAAPIEDRARATNVGSVAYNQRSTQRRQMKAGASAQPDPRTVSRPKPVPNPFDFTTKREKGLTRPVQTICRNPKYHCNGMAEAMFPPLSLSRSAPAQVTSAPLAPARRHRAAQAALAGRKPVVVGRSTNFHDSLNPPGSEVRISTFGKANEKNLHSTLSTRPVHMLQFSSHNLLGN